MQIGYFPGCSLTSTAQEYDASVRLLARNCGVELVEIEDWNCCGATPAAALSEELALALPLRNLLKADTQKLSSVLSPCPACHSHLLLAKKEVITGGAHKQRLHEIVDDQRAPDITLRHLVDFLYHDLGLETLKKTIVKPLEGMKLVSYYGCLTRLRGIEMEDQENPTMMDEIISALGADAPDWSHKTECCGASFSITKTDTVLRLVGEILAAANGVGADAVVVVCPLCQSNLDMRQAQLGRKGISGRQLPIVYLSQLILLAQGKGYGEVGFDKHLINPRSLIRP
jgi:heterodisulfide reductase subunit B